MRSDLYGRPRDCSSDVFAIPFTVGTGGCSRWADAAGNQSQGAHIRVQGPTWPRARCEAASRSTSVHAQADSRAGAGAAGRRGWRGDLRHGAQRDSLQVPSPRRPRSGVQPRLPQPACCIGRAESSACRRDIIFVSVPIDPPYLSGPDQVNRPSGPPARADARGRCAVPSGHHAGHGTRDDTTLCTQEAAGPKQISVVVPPGATPGQMLQATRPTLPRFQAPRALRDRNLAAGNLAAACRHACISACGRLWGRTRRYAWLTLVLAGGVQRHGVHLPGARKRRAWRHAARQHSKHQLSIRSDWRCAGGGTCRSKAGGCKRPAGVGRCGTRLVMWRSASADTILGACSLTKRRAAALRFLAVRCEASLEAKFCSSSAVQETRVFEHVIESPEWSGKDSST